MNHDAHTGSVQLRFSAAANTYDMHATVQAKVAARLIDFLPPKLPPGQILEIGCGTGLLTAYLLQKYPDAPVDAVDLSDRMIQYARNRFSDVARVRWFVADVVKIASGMTYPLVVSSCSLHWLSRLREGFRHIAALLQPGGTFAFAMMLYGTLGELLSTRLRVAPHKPPLRRLPTDAEVLECLKLANLTVLDAARVDYTDTFPGATAFLRSLHDQGLTGGEVSRSMLPLTRSELDDMVRSYDAQFAVPGGVSATYKVLFARAQKAPD